MTLLITSFLGGILTVFTPCVFLLLPIILAGNIAEKKLKNQIITIATLIFFIFTTTLLLKFSSIFIYVDERVWVNLSASIIIFLGLTYIFPNIWANKYFGNRFSKIGNKLSYFANSLSSNNHSSYARPILTGFALTPIFASCSPVYFLLLATVLPVNLGLGAWYLLVYCLGIGLTLFLIANLGQNLLLKINTKIVDNMQLKIIIGVLFIFLGILICFGLDKKIETKIGTPELVKNLDQQILLNPKIISETKKIIQVSEKNIQKVDKLDEMKKISYENLGTAKELVGISEYINVEENAKLADILKKNKIVLLEFWTYSCINCKRTMPYLNSWYEKYHTQGFEIVGVHTPEFAFEKVRQNVVKNSVAQGIKFPIFMDNDYATWNAYENHYWPMRILILPTGQIIYQHAGEGDYENNENLIRNVLNL